MTLDRRESTDGKMDGHYQVNYLPALLSYAVNNEMRPFLQLLEGSFHLNNKKNHDILPESLSSTEKKRLASE